MTNTQKPTQEWTTGDEPMTGAQKSYLKTLCDESGEQFDENLTKAQASEHIEELQHRNPRVEKQANKGNASQLDEERL